MLLSVDEGRKVAEPPWCTQVVGFPCSVGSQVRNKAKDKAHPGMAQQLKNNTGTEGGHEGCATNAAGHIISYSDRDIGEAGEDTVDGSGYQAQGQAHARGRRL